VLLVSWNGWGLLRPCLTSLADALRAASADAEVLVVDNGSVDGTAEGLAAEFPWVRRIDAGRNLGFAPANNLGAAEARGELLFLLNNDTIVDRESVAELLRAADAHPEFALFAPEMRRLEQPDVVDNRGIYLDLSGHFRQLDAGEPAARARGPAEVFGPSGGACLVRREVVGAVGLFADDLESYLEDADFAARARSAGYRTRFVPAARIGHAGSATGGRIADRKFYLIQRNMLALWRHWVGVAPGRSSFWLGLMYEAGQVVRAATRGRGRLVWRAKRDAARVRMLRPELASRTAAPVLHEWLGVRAREVCSAAPSPAVPRPPATAPWPA
jgi:GT2 family glycosyltransferase